MEMIIRKSFTETLKEYLSTSSLGGIKQIRDPANTRLQRIFWTGIFCVAVFLICFFLHSTWVTTFTRPFIVTDESSTYPISQIDFPAVSLCNFNRISDRALKKYAKKLHIRLGLKNMTTYDVGMVRHLGRLIDYRFDDNTQRQLNRLPNEIHVDVTNVMKELAPRCEEMLLKCKWAGKDVNCSDIFRIRRTSIGYCCAFNYILKLNATEKLNGGVAAIKRQEIPGPNNGLMIVADPMIEDYAYRIGIREGFQVLLHDARQFPDIGSGRVLYRMAQANQAQFLQIRSVKQYATSEVHKYPYKTRQCLFHNELMKTFENMYSSSACRIRCRMETIHSLCKCVPFYYPLNKDYKTCTLRHLRCLHKYREKLLYFYPIDAKNTSGLESELADSLYCPECLPDCELTQYFTRSYRVSLSKISRTGFESNFLVDVNVTNKCVLNIFHPTSVGILHRLDVVAYWFEILSNIGGFAGMMMGIGIYTFIEIIYYIMIRFVRAIYMNYKKYH